ncbi:MAG: 30S ribosomal protein S8 [Candidatus Peribacteraceae bacterium]
MTFTDPIGDFLTRMRNAQHGRHTQCRAPWSRIKQEIAEILQREGFIQSATVEGEGVKKEIVVAFKSDRPVLELRRVSKPGSRQYVQTSDVRGLLHGSAMALLSTSSGILTHTEAKQKNVGGEMICTVS